MRLIFSYTVTHCFHTTFEKDVLCSFVGVISPLFFYVPWTLVLLSLHSKELPLPVFTNSPGKIHLWIFSLDHLCIFRVNVICYPSYMLLDFIYCKLLRVFAVTCMRIWSTVFFVVVVVCLFVLILVSGW